MTPVRVRAIHTYYPHFGNHSGYPQLLRYLNPAVCAVTVARVRDGNAGWSIPWLGLGRPPGPRAVEGGMPWYRVGDLSAEVRAFSSCLVNGTGVVHYLDAEHSAQYLPRVLKLSRMSQVKTVATFHQPPGKLDGLIRRDVAAALDMVLLVSPTQEAYFREFLPTGRVRTILHGVDTDFFRPHERRTDTATFKCITVGHWLRDWDSMRAIVQALSSEDIEFHVVTGRTTGLEGMSNVVFHQHVDDDTLRRLYQQADVPLLPLIDSTTNNGLLEGLASGLPVISTRIPAVVAYAGEAPAVLVDVHDVDALIDAIVQLARQPDERRRMAAAARARAEELSWVRVAPRFEALYTELARTV